jgi:hypothetical protein
MNSIADIATTLHGPVQAADRVRPIAGGHGDADALRSKVSEFVGLTFFAPLLKQASDPVLKGEYLHGGRGEQVFRGQLNEILALRIGQSSRLGITDAVVRRLTGGEVSPATSQLDMTA